MKIFSVVMVVCVSLCGFSRAEKATLADFEGKYNKNGKLTVLTTGMTFVGPVSSLVLNVSKNEKKGTLKCSGSLDVPPLTDASNTFQFTNARLNVAKIAPVVVDLPTSGTFRVTRKEIKGSGLYTPSPGVTWTLSVTARKRGKIKQLTVTQLVFVSGVETYRYTYTASRRLKKSEL